MLAARSSIIIYPKMKLTPLVAETEAREIAKVRENARMHCLPRQNASEMTAMQGKHTRDT